MIGLPKTLKTKADYKNAVAYVLANSKDRALLTSKLQSLIDNQSVWIGKGEVEETYTSASDEKVIEQIDNGGETPVTAYHLFKLEPNANNNIIQAGITETEVNQLISTLEK